MNTSTPILEVSQLFYEYPKKRALENVSFSLRPGSVTALVGPNGSGKTTLLRCLAALESPFSGSITVGGFDTVVDPRSCHELLGYLSDNFGLYDGLAVRQCLLHQGSIQGLSGSQLQSSIERVTAELDLGGLLHQRAGNLSRGQRQRVGVALATLHLPKILLLDEPASGLDPEARSELAVLFRKLRTQGLCILVSSHILAELEDYCDRMLTLREGKILGDESVVGKESADEVRVRIELLHESPELQGALRASANVSSLELQEGGATFLFKGSREGRASLLRELVERRIPVLEFAAERLSLETVYKRQIEEEKKR